MMDFQIHVYDEREDLNTLKANSYAHTIQSRSDYSKLREMIPAGKNHYVVIMTFGYRSDDIVMRALLGNEYKYLGMLGSKKKIEKMFAVYRAEGISEEKLKKIHAPIGIEIKSQTPEEIAVS